jgi:hypothetical protein
MVSNKNMVTDCLLAKVNFPLYAAEMLTSRFVSSIFHDRLFLLMTIVDFQASTGSWRRRISQNRRRKRF